ncbi:hypothetical protein F4810DRAFT_702873 [Camillea tinctor]|nr:hypothetical protein F4810DRAFT_702873 [Camillea tinctor]
MREKLLDSICPYTPDHVHRNLSKARAKDSGTWLFTLPIFEKWRNTSTTDDIDTIRNSNCIWLSGNLGTGKTMLMSAVIDHLLANVGAALVNKNKKTAILYYYFYRGLPSRPRDAIASVLRQLCSQKDVDPLPQSLADRLAAVNKASGSRGDTSDTIATHAVDECPDLIPLQARFDDVYICLDGLEECEDLVALFELLARLPDIRRYLEMYITTHVYLADTIGPEAFPNYLKLLAERCRGNFLVATTETTKLNRLTTRFDINRLMEKANIGTQYPELFNQIWSRLNYQPPLHATLAKRIFHWLSISRRALTLKELQQAIAIEPDGYLTHQLIDQGERLPPPSLIEEVCMGFAWVDTTNDRVFTNPSALPFYFYQFNMSFAAEAREYAAKCCVAFLNIEILSDGAFKAQREYDQMDRKLPFSRYASQYWGTHLNDSREGDIQVITERLLRKHAANKNRYDKYPSKFTGKHFGAYFRPRAAFSKWRSPQDWEALKDSWGRTPLHIASVSSSLYCRHVILDACNDNTFGFVVSERQATDTGDSNNKEDNRPFSMLPWTWDWTNDATERLNLQSEDRFSHLLDTLFDLQHSSDKGNDTGIHSWANKWSLDNIMSPIFTTATGGHLWPLKQLLVLVKSRLGTEMLDFDFNAAVIEASKRSFTDIVDLLRGEGANIGKLGPDEQDITAMNYAACGNHLETVRYLILEGADPCHLDILGRSPFFCAVENGNQDVVPLLISKGMDPDAYPKGINRGRRTVQ